MKVSANARDSKTNEKEKGAHIDESTRRDLGGVDPGLEGGMSS